MSRFAFGENWLRFVTGLTTTQIDNAVSSLRVEMGLFEPLEGKTFLDVGCGSGLTSLAALRLGASVVAIDVDLLSARCTQGLLETHAPGGPWRVILGSALDFDFMSSLGDFATVSENGYV